jgi:hypothetical protein
MSGYRYGNKWLYYLSILEGKERESTHKFETLQVFRVVKRCARKDVR